MKIYISHHPRLRTSFAQKWKPFAIVSLMLVLIAGFQNFAQVDSEVVAGSEVHQSQVFHVVGVVTNAKAFQTTDGPFNVITGQGDKTFRVEYLGSLDVSGKGCMALAQQASQSKQNFEVTGILALPNDRGIVFQKVLDCGIRPVTPRLFQNHNGPGF